MCDRAYAGLRSQALRDISLFGAVGADVLARAVASGFTADALERDAWAAWGSSDEA